MRALSLNLRESDDFPEIEPDLSLFESANLVRFYFPERGILYSFLVHVALFAFLIMYPLFHIPPVERVLFPERPFIGRYYDSKVLMYLPLVGGGNPGGDLPGRRSRPGRGRASAASIPGSKGMSYPGPQRILSDVPNPTNRVQTLLQPGLKNPPPLKLPLRLPNLVRMADLGLTPRLELPRAVLQAPKPPAPPPAVRSVVPVMPLVALNLPKPVATPRMILPASMPQAVPMPELKQPEEEAPAQKAASVPEPSRNPAEQTKAEPLVPTSVMPKDHPAQEISTLPGGGTDRRNLLALSPFPTIPEEATAIPLGEARGRFAISPEPGPGGPDDKLGSNIEGSSSAAGIGNQASASGNAGTQMGQGSGTGSAAGTGTGGGGGSGTGSGAGPGSGSGSGTAAGSGSGTGRGSGSGSGTGTGSGSGSGAGSGPGKGAFSGISIIGGVGATGTSRSAAPRPATPPRPLQTSYGLTVIATGTSGGGLPLFDVFSHEEVYTVYLDVRRNEADTIPPWPLEFALVQDTAAQANVADVANRNPQWLVLPFPAYKDLPVFPAELVRRYRGRMIVVYAIINVEGKMEQFAIKASPDARLNVILLDTLKRWIFRPARVRGEPVAAKVLLGIPMWLPE